MEYERELVSRTVMVWWMWLNAEVLHTVTVDGGGVYYGMRK